MGRADELAELVALLDAALDGRSRVAVLAGEPGIGKTRLAEELAALAGRPRGAGAVGWLHRRGGRARVLAVAADPAGLARAGRAATGRRGVGRPR